ncbi:hypothetical protein Poli38472_003737 [Pythium oligandrum]|uniref:Tafazzin family protein n=1 Tax=Pythium oligandrum TaxID=41045 RepID=A0A8K1FNK7_PYTOL|nr:hypothetical protein Poli38472_003737 [Pythium oligandrum]|eukprot:TMW65972.1 hypothetical protein Poli38472_003737 [Pythium oligandrum]
MMWLLAMLWSVLRYVVFVAVMAMAAGTFALYLDAPVGDRGDGLYHLSKREPLCPEWLHNLGRIPVIGTVTWVSKLYLRFLSTMKTEGLEHLLHQLENRPTKTPLITVSNHTSAVDDPAVISSVLPWKYALPWRARWIVTSQEYSFVLGQMVRAFFYGGKSMPIWRGGGLDQPLLESIFDKVQQGKWVHIFPEGKIQQKAVIGGRTGEVADKLGRLKWGVGKLIARADVRPVVVPFYHTNMHKIMPQDDKNNLTSLIPQSGTTITVRFGEPIDFTDLFEKYREHRVVGSESDWTTQAREYELYSAITKRIEDAILALANGIYEKTSA